MSKKTRIALVTGANRGLGQEVAVRLAEQGTTVWVGARKFEEAARVARGITERGGQATPIELDVTDSKSIAQAVATVERGNGQLDILVNNAGIMIEGEWVGNTSATIGADVLRKTFDVNFFGLVAVTQAFLPLLRKSGDASVVNVSSVMGSSTLHADLKGPLAYTKPFGYDASKAAVNAFTVHLAAAVEADGILVNSAHPGWVKTELGTEAAELSVEDGAKTIVELALRRKGAATATFVHRDQSLPF